MKNIRIDYHTGTGGTKLVAELLAEKLKNNNTNVEVNRIFRDKINGINEINIDYYILIFPVHSFCAPKPIYEWIEHLAGNHCKTAVISVSGGGNVLSNTASRVKTVKLLKKSNFNITFEEMIRMPNNWMKAPGKKKYTSILSKLPNEIETISQIVLAEKKQRKIIYWIDYLLSALGELEKKSTRKFGNRINVLDTCNSCGLCAKNCCSSNIIIENQRPKIGSRCDMCLGCIYNCPRKALKPTYGAFQVDKKGYDLRLMCKNANLESNFYPIIEIFTP
ncbi:MAG: EFR1 family ferrodoxin [Bacteroidetes bacterium]|nr:EFR1 family ferrodoxin [Bacteroidota bacterium]MCL2302363.1 EFR1 family ferrodoxin [Lentimicrobiaceae bacterium]